MRDQFNWFDMIVAVLVAATVAVYLTKKGNPRG